MAQAAKPGAEQALETGKEATERAAEQGRRATDQPGEVARGMADRGQEATNRERRPEQRGQPRGAGGGEVDLLGVRVDPPASPRS